MNKRMKNLVTILTLCCCVVVMAGSNIAFAQSSEVKEITVRGNTRVEAETIETYLTIQPDIPFSDSDIDESLKAMFATGLFQDVTIVHSGESLIVTVVENPLIREISFEGNSRITNDALQDVIQSEEREVLTQSRVQGDLQLILEAYRRIGRYRASVEPKYIEQENNRVDLVFEIHEGSKTQIEQIAFIGNRNFSDGQLRDVIQTREAGLLSFLRTTDVYDPDRFDADQEMLRRFYFQRGYADFRIISAVADLDREQNIFHLTFTLDEGVQYRYNDISVETTLTSIDLESIEEVLETETGDIYNSDDVEKSIENLTVEVSKQGYAFAEVRPRLDRNTEARTIDITFVFEEGPRVYVERINITGNNRTRENVIRREIDLAEGDAFNRVLLDIAERRLNRLNYFSGVSISTDRGSAPDRIIITVAVTEQPTGELSFGIGYSTSDGFVGDISVTEKNFLGRGQYVKVSGSYGQTTTRYEFEVREPFFLGRRVSFGFDIFRRELSENNFRNFDELSTGGGISFGFPLRDDELTLNTNYNFRIRDIEISSSTSSPVIRDSAGETTSSLVGYSIVNNTVDSIKLPRGGIYASFAQDIAGLGGDSEYVRTRAEGRGYYPIVSDWEIIGMLSAKGGHITSWGARLKLQDQFFIGGETVRGFQSQGIGPRDNSSTDKDALGGTIFVAATAEATFPIPILPEELGIRGAFFSDIGSLWAFDEAIAKAVEDFDIKDVESNDLEIRASYGIGFSWDSPFGPIRADFGFPIIKHDLDKTEIFRLSGGSQF